MVHVVAGSGPVDPGRVSRGLAHVRRRCGEASRAANLERTDGYFAGNDDARLAGLMAALEDEQATRARAAAAAEAEAARE